MLAVFFFSAVLLCGGCGAASTATAESSSPPAQPGSPAMSSKAALNGAVTVTLTTRTSGAVIYYTVDGSEPTTASQIYQAPFLVAGNLTVKAIAAKSGGAPSSVTSQTFTLNIPSGTLVWADEFANSTSSNAAPDPAIWTYDTGNSGFGNHELETYCAWGSNSAPCSATSPSVFVGADGLSAHRCPAALRRCLHLGAAQDAGPLQLSVRSL